MPKFGYLDAKFEKKKAITKFQISHISRFWVVWDGFAIFGACFGCLRLVLARSEF